MTARVTISIDDDLLAAVRAAASIRQSSVSAVIADATEREMTRRAGIEAVREWEAEHGPITAAQRESASQRIAETLERLARRVGVADTADAA